MSPLERRYTRWTALFYPAGYRRERGSELVDTYLALAAPGRRRPSVADVADLAAGGLRQHLRIAPGLGPGVRLAGLLALATATALATGWTLLEAFTPTPHRHPLAGPFLTLGVAAWVAWLGAAVVHLAAPGRWYRRAAGLAVLVTAGLVPAAALTGLPRPPLFLLLPQVALGVVALGAAGRRPWWVRAIPVVAAAAGVPIATAGRGYDGTYYRSAATALPAVAAALLIVATLLALGLSARRDHRGAWALLILFTPIGMLALTTLGAVLDDSGLGRPVVPAWPAMVVASVLVTVIGSALAPLALAALGRLSPGGRERGTARCPTCGAPSASG